MKIFKKICILAALVCSGMLLVACGGEVEYKITVTDALGNTYGKDTIVEFYDGDEKVAMQTCDENGVATKKIEKGTYTIKVMSTEKTITYNLPPKTQVTPSKTEIQVEIANCIQAESTVLYVQGDEYDAYPVLAGCTSIDLKDGEKSYYLFTPTQGGTYEIFVKSDADITIGYYGSPYFVQEFSIVEPVDGVITESISDTSVSTEGAGTTVLVIGVEAKGDDSNATLCVKRAGDPERTIEDEPWTVYKPTETLSKYTLPEGKTLVDFDVTAADYRVVFNETDGYYHLNDANGPLVVVYLTENPTIAYVPCFKNILDRSGISKYVYDEDGNFVEKVTYDQCLLEYFDYADDNTGVYPLTEDLRTIIQERGEYVGWWDTTSPSFIFKDPNGNPVEGFNAEIAWLFMCAYLE